MKKNVFYFISTYFFVLIFIFKAQAQFPDQPNFKPASPFKSGFAKSASKLSSELNILYKNHLMKTNQSVEDVKPALLDNGMQRFIQMKEDKVFVDLIVTEDNSTTRAELEKTGFKISAAYGRVISGAIPVDAISKLETVTNLKFARPVYKPIHSQFKSVERSIKWGAQSSNIKPVISQGDTAQRSYLARNKYKVNGKGVKIGLISDSYNNLGTADSGVAHGELPGLSNPFGFTTPVKVLEDDYTFSGADEGRAMAEIVHDVAPGAEIAFHTADISETDLAQGIRDLAKYGCKVIADDVNYYDEPFFQDGIVAQAVDDVKKDGVTYFSAAGNEARQSYESRYHSSDYEYAALDSFLGYPAGTAHNFSAPGDRPVYFQPIKIPTNRYAIFSFQWDDPFYSATGGIDGAKTDLGIWLFDSKGKLVSGSDYTNTGGDPFEIFGYQNFDSSSTSFYLLITKYSGPDPVHLKYICYPDLDYNIFGAPIPGIYASAVVGHAKAKGAIATAAAWWKYTPAYLSDTPRIETFSSVGGVPNYLNTIGKRINAVVRKKPEITAPDGGNTSFFGYDLTVSDTDTFPNFFGTSAAAPHAAGVAALMIEAQKPGIITPDEVKVALTENAFDMNNRYTPGFDKGFDYNTGYGFIQADKAVGAVKFPAVLVKDLNLEAVCSDNPDSTLNFKITNPNSFDVDAHWLLLGHAQADNITVPPGEKTFSTKTEYVAGFPVPEVVVIDWKDNLNTSHIDVAYSIATKCGQNIVSGRNTAQKPSNTADAKSVEKPNTVEVYPNPVTKNFKVYMSLNKLENADINLYSADGKVIYQKTGLANKGIIDIDASTYKPGLYILKVRQGEFYKTFKVIKQ